MTPMRVLHDRARPDRRAPALLVLLPGALQPPEQLLAQGFVDAVRERGLALDMMLADPGLGFIGEASDSSATQRLKALLAPERAHYKSIWLAGISLGGFIAMAHAARHPGGVRGLCLLSPYPGNRVLTNAIVAAGGPAAWAAHMAEDDDDERNVWRWLAQDGAARLPALHFGYAAQDRFAAGQRLMAAMLPPAQVDVIDGNHDWPSWRVLWNNFLERCGAQIGGQG